MALVALLVDYLAVTRRSPSLAGLPLMATFLGAAANSGGSLNPLFFLAAAAAWLVLVARQGAFLLRRWSTTIATPLTPVRDTADGYGGASYATVARSLGAAALVVAVAAPGRAAAPAHPLPARRPRPQRRGRGRDGSVGFSQSLEPGRRPEQPQHRPRPDLPHQRPVPAAPARQRQHQLPRR